MKFETRMNDNLAIDALIDADTEEIIINLERIAASYWKHKKDDGPFGRYHE